MNKKFDWDNFNQYGLNDYLKNELFEGIVAKHEFLILNEIDEIDIAIDKKNTLLIAIHDVDKKIHSTEIVKDYKDVIQLKFWDVEEEIGNYKPISIKQAKELKEFILKYKNPKENSMKNNSKFLIHCSAGMSRSAGIGMAIECLIKFNGNKYEYSISKSDIKEHPRYEPNYTVYDKIIS